MEALVYCIGMWVSFLDKNSSEFNVAASRERTCIQLYIYIWKLYILAESEAVELEGEENYIWASYPFESATL